MTKVNQMNISDREIEVIIEESRQFIKISSLESELAFHDSPQPFIKTRDGKLIQGSIHQNHRVCKCTLANRLRQQVSESSLPPDRIENADELKTIFIDEAEKVCPALSNEEIMERITKLELVVRQSRIRISGSRHVLAEREAKMSRAEKEAWKEKSKTYKVRPPVNDDDNGGKKIKAAPKTREDKAAEALMAALGLSREEAMNRLKKGLNG